MIQELQNKLTGLFAAVSPEVLDQLMVVIAAALTAQSLLRRATRRAFAGTDPPHTTPPRAWLAVAALVATALAARLAVPPALLHSNFHAMTILESILSFPTHAVHRASYGQASFMALGAICKVLGRSVETVVHANVVFQTTALTLAATLAGRSGGPWAAIGALSVGALSPLMLRVAASEDAHNFATCVGMLALLWADTWRRRPGDTSDALGVVGACVLCAGARQSMVLWALLVIVLAAPPRPGVRERAKAIWPAVALGAALLVPVTLVRLRAEGDRSSYLGYAVGSIICQGPAFWMNHPLLGDPTSWPLLALATLGLYAAWRRRIYLFTAVGAVALVQAAMTFAVSCSPMPREAAYQRLALFTLLVPIAGYGVSVLASAPRLGRLARPLAVASMVAALAVAAPGFVRLRHTHEPFYAELVAVRSHLAGRGPVTVVVPSFQGTDLPSWISSTVLQNPAVRIVSADSLAARLPGALRLEGISCYAFILSTCYETVGSDNLSSLSSLGRFREAVIAGLSDPLDFMRAMRCPIRQGPRRECGDQFRRGRFEPWATIDVPQDQVPVVYFSERRITIGVWTGDAAGAAP